VTCTPSQTPVIGDAAAMHPNSQRRPLKNMPFTVIICRRSRLPGGFCNACSRSRINLRILSAIALSLVQTSSLPFSNNC